MRALTKIGDSLAESVAIDRATLELEQLDAARVKIIVQAGRLWFDPIEVTEGVGYYTITYYPMVLECDVKLGLNRARWVEAVYNNREVPNHVKEESEKEGEILKSEIASVADEEAGMEISGSNRDGGDMVATKLAEEKKSGVNLELANDSQTTFD